MGASANPQGARYFVLLLSATFLVDAVNGFFLFHLERSFGLGVVFRFIILTMYVFLVVLRSRLSSLIGLCIVILFLISVLVRQAQLEYDLMTLFTDLNILVRILFPIAIFTLVNHYKLSVEQIAKILSGNALTLIGAFAFSLLTGQFFYSYGDYTFGQKSFFVSGNDIALAAALLQFAVLYVGIHTGRGYFIILGILLMFPVVMVFSRAGIVFAAFNMGYVLVSLKGSWRLMIVPAVLVAGLFLASKIGALLGAIGGFHLDRFALLLENNSRAIMISIASDIIGKFSVMDHLFGIGSLAQNLIADDGAFSSAVDQQSVEVDPMDIYMTFGAILTAAIYWFYFRVSAPLLSRGLFVVSWAGLFFLHSTLAGHAITSVQAGYAFMLGCYLFSLPLSDLRAAGDKNSYSFSGA